MSTGTASPLPKKLGLSGEIVFTVRRAPSGFAAQLAAEGGTGDAIWQQSLLAPIDLVIAFHTHRALLVAEWPKLTAPLAPGGGVWIACPRPGAGLDTDLTEDAVRAALLPTGWVDDKACTIDAAWSALRFVARPTTQRPKDRAAAAAKAKRRR
ncbi:MAG: hypothetical protein KDB40_13240 [Acidimicrobiales bacterium]|nr:hypothetical protein [Acidimicrobiales bacterium]MCB9392495.1 DUF3052 domain-containing protein [Acidimicrobiaceae bacterium]